MTKRSRRYFFHKKMNKMIVKHISEGIRQEIDRMILEEMLKIADKDRYEFL